MTATQASTTGNLTFSNKPEDGAAAYMDFDIDPLLGDRPCNYIRENKSVVIENIRGKEDSVSLNTTGFQFYKHTSKYTKFDNDEEIRREYYPESRELIKKLTGASRVELFDHIVRRRIPGQLDVPGFRQPLPRVHVDQTAATARTLVHMYLPASEVPGLLQRRFQIINLWRPIGHPALDYPMAFCDYRSVDLENDPFPVTRILSDRTASPLELLSVQYNKNHKWKYLYGMTPEEIVLVKWQVHPLFNLLVSALSLPYSASNDSLEDGSVAVFTPHTSFCDPATPEGAPPRQSIELRALVFYD